jgi:hypothetical protein
MGRKKKVTMKQSQSVKQIVNVHTCCDKKKKRKGHRKRAANKQAEQNLLMGRQMANMWNDFYSADWLKRQQANNAKYEVHPNPLAAAPRPTPNPLSNAHPAPSGVQQQAPTSFRGGVGLSSAGTARSWRSSIVDDVHTGLEGRMSDLNAHRRRNQHHIVPPQTPSTQFLNGRGGVASPAASPPLTTTRSRRDQLRLYNSIVEYTDENVPYIAARQAADHGGDGRLMRGLLGRIQQDREHGCVRRNCPPSADTLFKAVINTAKLGAVVTASYYAHKGATNAMNTVFNMPERFFNATTESVFGNDSHHSSTNFDPRSNKSYGRDFDGLVKKFAQKGQFFKATDFGNGTQVLQFKDYLTGKLTTMRRDRGEETGVVPYNPSQVSIRREEVPVAQNNTWLQLSRTTNDVKRNLVGLVHAEPGQVTNEDGSTITTTTETIPEYDVVNKFKELAPQVFQQVADFSARHAPDGLGWEMGNAGGHPFTLPRNSDYPTHSLEKRQ